MRILHFVPTRTIRLLISLACILLLMSACASMPRMLGGSGDLDLRLDGEQAHEANLPAGRVMVLDMRDPGQSGYVFSGTSFDAKLLRLDGIEPYDGGRRVRYTFTALTEGECDVVIKIKRNEPGYIPDIFKRVRVTIEK